jgi:hypothetical protein
LADTTTTSGFLMLQTTTTPNFGAGNLSGSFALGSTEDVTGVKGSIVGTFTFDGANKYTAIADIVGVPNAAIQANATFTGTTAINEDGAGVIDGGTRISLPTARLFWQSTEMEHSSRFFMWL